MLTGEAADLISSTLCKQFNDSLSRRRLRRGGKGRGEDWEGVEGEFLPEVLDRFPFLGILLVPQHDCAVIVSCPAVGRATMVLRIRCDSMTRRMHARTARRLKI